MLYIFYKIYYYVYSTVETFLQDILVILKITKNVIQGLNCYPKYFIPIYVMIFS